MPRSQKSVAIADADGHLWTRALSLSDNNTLLDGVTRHRDGYLIADAKVARVGLQTYRGYEVGLPDQDRVTLYRPPEEVFATDSMRSHANKPVTLTHPKQMVDAKSWSKVAKGFSGSEVVRDGDYVRVPLMLTDAAAIKAFDEGRARELSVGYTTDIDWTPGQTPDGQPYHGVQRDIRTNHHALVPVARGGANLRIGDAMTACPSCGGDVMDTATSCPTCGFDLKPTDGDIEDDDEMYDAAFTAEERSDLAKRGLAKPDGSYPIRNTADLKNAISAYGRGGATASDKAWIKKRAKALGAEGILPDDWQSQAADAAFQRSNVMPITKTFDGVPIQFVDEVSAAAMTREVTRLQTALDAAAAAKKKDDDDDADAVTAQQKKNQDYQDSIKAKDGEIAVLKKQVADATLTDAQIDVRIAERVRVFDAAKPHLPKDYNPAGKSLSDIRRAAVGISLGDAAIKDWDEPMVTGAFEALTRGGAKKGGASALADGMTQALRTTEGHTSGTSLVDAEKDAATAHAEYVKRLQDGYKTPISTSRN